MPSLEKLCNLIAEQGMQIANKSSSIFIDLIEQEAKKGIGDEDKKDIFKVFAFLNWAFANGVWSNLSNTKLRRDLMSQSMRSIVLRTAFELSETKSDEKVAMLAVDLDQEFKDFAADYNKRIKELSSHGYDPDANVAFLFGLEWLQNRIGLTDDDMELLVPEFVSRGDYAEIEGIANQVNLADNQTKK